MEGQEKDVEKQSCSQKNSTTNNSKNNAQKEKPNVSSGVQLQPTAQQQQQPFKKGRRRARSMPPSHHVEKQATTARDSASRQQQNSHKTELPGNKRRVHRHVITTTAPNARSRKPPDFDAIEVMEREGDFELPINEQEMMHFPIEHNDDGECDDERHRMRKRFWQLNWKRVHFTGLPAWLQDNEYLHGGHRPELGNFGSCFKSIFALHTETGNIWTHMYGCVAFIGMLIWLLTRPADVIAWPDKLIFSAFFIGAILCMGMSFAFHTVQCHSEDVGRLFSKLDYSGISLLIIGSFVPWLYYAFFCRALAMSIYIGMIVVLGVAAVIVSLWDKFAQPKFRPLRAGIFLAMGLSSVVPAIHLAFTDGFKWMFENASFHWLILMGCLYILGAVVYMARFPERCFPGKCDILCQSHQLFHLFVIFAAAVHYYGILELAQKRLEGGSCSEQLIDEFGTDQAPIPWIEDKLRPH